MCECANEKMFLMSLSTPQAYPDKSNFRKNNFDIEGVTEIPTLRDLD
jgi:hypothetical protein